MTRLPYLGRESLDETGAALWDQITETRGAAVQRDGGLAGPFNAWVHAPEVGRRLADLGNTLRFGMSIDRRLIELAIITTGAWWRSEFEFWAHARMAREHGNSDAVIEAIAGGEEPALETAEERAVYAATRSLLEHGQLPAPTYDAASEHLGDRGMVELVSLVGYYTLVSFTLNGFEVPLPDGVAPRWP